MDILADSVLLVNIVLVYTAIIQRILNIIDFPNNYKVYGFLS